jgi:hypothetical protein
MARNIVIAFAPVVYYTTCAIEIVTEIVEEVIERVGCGIGVW